jgi:hypothetical protein
MATRNQYNKNKQAMRAPTVSACFMRGSFIYFDFFFLDLPALLKAIAIACFAGFPAFRSVAMFSDMTFLLDPDFKGIKTYSASFSSSSKIFS